MLGLVAGALLCAAAVAGGAFGAHALRGRLEPRALELWETAARYLMYAGLALLAFGLAERQLPRPGLRLGAQLLLAGALVFSATVGALALGAPRWLGAVTPLGGVLMIAAFLVFAWAVARG